MVAYQHSKIILVSAEHFALHGANLPLRDRQERARDAAFVPYASHTRHPQRIAPAEGLKALLVPRGLRSRVPQADAVARYSEQLLHIVLPLLAAVQRRIT